MAFPVCGRRGVGSVPEDAGLQGGVVRGSPHRGPEEFPLHPSLLPLWTPAREDAPLGAGLLVRGLRSKDGPRPKGGPEPQGLRAGPPDGLYREFPGKSRLWRLLWRRNGLPRLVYELWVAEAGSGPSSPSLWNGEIDDDGLRNGRLKVRQFTAA